MRPVRLVWEERVQVAATLERRVAIDETPDGYVVLVALCSPSERGPRWSPRSRTTTAYRDAQALGRMLFSLACGLASGRGYRTPLDAERGDK
jgi:hypothetical protein